MDTSMLFFAFLYKIHRFVIWAARSPAVRIDIRFFHMVNYQPFDQLLAASTTDDTTEPGWDNIPSHITMQIDSVLIIPTTSTNRTAG